MAYKEIYNFVKSYVLGETQETVDSEPVKEPKEKDFSRIIPWVVNIFITLIKNSDRIVFNKRSIRKMYL